jgi:hypothetical protein
MNPFDANIVRVYAREVGGTIPDNTIRLNATNDFQVVVEYEAGNNLIALGVQYTLRIEAIDLTDVNSPATSGNPNFNQTLVANFTAPQNTHVFTVHAAMPANVKDDFMQYRAVIRTTSGGNNPTVFSDNISEVFVLL